MALKKPTFENEPTNNAGDTAVAEAPAAVETAAAPAAAPTPVREPEVVASTAIAKASQTSIAVADAAADAKRFKREVEDMKGASDFSYGNYSVFKGNNGEVSCSDTKESFGRWVKVRLMSWNEHTEVSPGETGASTKSFVAYSQDGKTIDSVIGEELRGWVGKSVVDYVEYLRKEEDFSKTKSRRFIDTACFVLASDSGDGPIGKTVQITLSETSISAFTRYQQELMDNARAASMGLPANIPADPFQFFFLREVASKAQNTWTKLRIVQDLPAKI